MNSDKETNKIFSDYIELWKHYQKSRKEKILSILEHQKYSEKMNHLKSQTSETKPFGECAILGSFLADINPEIQYNSIEKTESPDFVMKKSNKKIGIELVGDVNEENAGKIEECKKIIKNIEEELEKQKNTKYLEIYFYINKESLENIPENMKMKEKKKIEESAISYINSIRQDDYKSCHPSELPFLIEVDNSLKLEKDIFHPRPYTYGKEDCDLNAKIYDLIKKKDEKIKNYTPCDEQWLIIHCNTDAKSGFILCNKVQKTPDSKFNKVFLYDFLHSKIEVLKDDDVK